MKKKHVNSDLGKVSIFRTGTGLVSRILLNVGYPYTNVGKYTRQFIAFPQSSVRLVYWFNRYWFDVDSTLYFIIVLLFCSLVKSITMQSLKTECVLVWPLPNYYYYYSIYWICKYVQCVWFTFHPESIFVFCYSRDNVTTVTRVIQGDSLSTLNVRTVFIPV